MKSVLLYLLLVGIPVLGVSLVLEAGSKLTPPVSFSGTWEIEVWPDTVCATASRPDTLGMTVEQSGPELVVRFKGGTQLVGRVEGDQFRAWGKDRVRMQGRRIRESVHHRLEGVILGAPCPAAIQTTIIGIRLHTAGRTAAH